MPSFRPPCIHEAHFRHRGAPFSGSLRPSATVAAWQPGPAAPVRGKASIPPGVVSTGSGAAVRRDLPGSISACVHPCPEKRPIPKFSAHSPASTGPCIRPSLRSDVDLLCPLSTHSLATGQAFTIADPDHASSFSSPTNCKKKQPPHPKRRAAVAAAERSICVFQLSGLWPGWLKRRTGFTAPPTTLTQSPRRRISDNI